VNREYVMSKSTRHSSPTTNHYLMPAEWEKQSSILLAWPHNKEDWPGKFEPIPWVYGEIIRHITASQKVRLIVRNDKERDKANDILSRAGAVMKRVEFHIIPTNRIWMRDSGPIFVKNAKGKKSMLDWRFNAWAKYPNHKLDDKVPTLLNQAIKIERIQPMHKGKRVVLEGGSIDVNGKGTLLTTEECLLSDVQERNPGFGREDYEQVFEKYLGIKQIIWLGNGIIGDDTHGHVDDITRFVSADTVVTVVEKDKQSKNHLLLADNVKRLKAARDQNGKQLNIVELPMPKPVIFEKEILPASYANFLIANDVVLVPTFNDPADRVALSILSELFKGRDVIGIHAVDLVWGLGTIHCMSQQEPA
jgi:agmatine deiminase